MQGKRKSMTPKEWEQHAYFELRDVLDVASSIKLAKDVFEYPALIELHTPVTTCKTLVLEQLQQGLWLRRIPELIEKYLVNNPSDKIIVTFNALEESRPETVKPIDTKEFLK